MKTILLLGGFGFIATNLLKYIDNNLMEEYKVIVFDRINYHPHGIKCNCVSKVYSGDFSDELLLENIFKENKIDFVMHFLSSTVPSTSQNALFDVESNLVPTIKLLETMKKYDVKDILYLSSGGAIYGDALMKVHNEEDAVYPKSSYGVVKLAIEKYLLSYSELWGFKTLVLRLSNPFGPYHYSDKQGIINIAVRKALSGERFQIWGDGNGIKDYIYIYDVCDIIMKLIDRGIASDVINVAGANALSVNDIVNAISEELPTFTYEHITAVNSDVQSFELDITKLRSIIGGMYSRTSFKDALKHTIDWQSQNLNINV